MNDQQVRVDADRSWAVIEATRLQLASILDAAGPDAWQRPSLCDRWRVIDVAAHVTLAAQPPSPAAMLVDGLRARGRFHVLNHDTAVRHADRPGADLVAELRQHAGSRRLPAVTNYRNTLFDVMVHLQDVCIPLGVPTDLPLDAARAATQRVWTMGWPFHARRRLRGYRLTATDTDWTAGDGLPVDGPITALLLLVTGRTARRDELTGSGAQKLRRPDR